MILILDISAIIHQLPCCYVVTTSKIGLYVGFPALFGNSRSSKPLCDKSRELLDV